MMNIEVTFPGGKRVDAKVGEHVVRTDQPVEAGGGGSAVSPTDLFLASIATCAGFYVLAFCQARGLPTHEIGLRQHVELDASTKLPTRVRLEVQVPSSFPEKHLAAIVRAAESCKVKKTIAAGPRIEVLVARADATLSRAS